MKIMTRKLTLLAVFVTLLPCLALAGGVSFTTTGSFSNPNLFPITFTGVTYTNIDGGNLSFGTFSLGTCMKHEKCKGTETFTLHIDQTAPTPGSGELEATLFGHVKMTGRSMLTITFTKATITIGSIVYNIPAFTQTINGMGTTTLNGSVQVPEPAAGLMLGLGVLGLMGFSTVSRKLIST